MLDQERIDHNIEKYLSLAVERHKIYKWRESGTPKPWTEDVVFRDFFFCNVFRQYDKCSKWIINNIVPYERWDLLILYRFMSTYSLFKRIEEEQIPFDAINRIQKFLEKMKKNGETLFSSCFIRNPRIPGGWTETYNVPFFLIEEIKSEGSMQEMLAKNSLELMVEYLSQFSGTKGFMGYEYASDFEYTAFFNPTDKYTWCNKGPGAQKGLSLLVYDWFWKRFSKPEWLKWTRYIFEKMKKRFKEDFPEEDLSMREVEHWLCEYQKYVKYKASLFGNHKVKYRKYQGGI